MTSHPAALVLGITGVVLAVALIGGPALASWRLLARTYPDRPFAVETSIRGASGHFGVGGSVERSLLLEMGSAGLRISVWKPLQPLLPTIMIPWSEVTACTEARHYFSPMAARLETARWPHAIFVWHRLWRYENLPELIYTHWRENIAKGT